MSLFWSRRSLYLEVRILPVSHLVGPFRFSRDLHQSVGKKPGIQVRELDFSFFDF